jgi:hypothetical protein
MNGVFLCKNRNLSLLGSASNKSPEVLKVNNHKENKELHPTPADDRRKGERRRSDRRNPDRTAKEGVLTTRVRERRRADRRTTGKK